MEFILILPISGGDVALLYQKKYFRLPPTAYTFDRISKGN
jgi:hypothetical protein